MIDDPRLLNLNIITNGEIMAEHINRYLHTLGLSPAWNVTHCAIEKVYFRWAKRCDVLYRLTFQDASGRTAEEWIYGQMFPPEKGFKRFQKMVSTGNHSHSVHNFLQELPPVSFWKEFEMIVWIFPADPELVSLPEVDHPAFVKKQIDANLSVFGMISGENSDNQWSKWRCTDVQFERIKHMPRKRCVLRFRVNLTSDAGETREITFYSKTSKGSANRYYFDLLKKAYQHLETIESTVKIPQPLLYLDGYDTVWQADWGGKPVIDVFNQFDPEEFFPGIAGMIAAFHQSQIKGLPPGPDYKDVLREAAEDGAKLIHIVPQYQFLVDMILTYLNETKGMMECSGRTVVPIHGACRLEQMLLKGNELTLVDFDALACGDPLYDIAQCIASLQYLAISQGMLRDKLAKAAEVLYESYTAQVKWSCDRRQMAWYALAFLLSKMYTSVKNLDIPALQRLEFDGWEHINDWFDLWWCGIFSGISYGGE